MTQEAIPFHVVQSELRTQLPFVAIASVVAAAGILSIVLAAFRTRERLLLWLGIFCIFYGARLFLENHLVQTALGLDQHTARAWILYLTYLIPIPYACFSRELLGAGWKRSIAIWLSMEIGFAIIAIPLFAVTRDSYWTDPVNTVLVIGGTLLLLAHVVGRRGQSVLSGTGLVWPLVICSTFVLLNNRGYRPGGINIEPIGFLTLIGGLAVAASRLAIARERKLTEVEQELKTARRIQNSIIPQTTPEIRGVRIATRYQPMTAVAGDFFDFLASRDDVFTILVADVSGHGVPAALVASMLKISFAAQKEHANDPARILSGLNGMLRGSLGGQYVTAACAAVNISGRNLVYAGAGHPPGLLLRSKTREVLELKENGLFLGPFPQASYSNMSVMFEAGDKLLLYTDGILEATRPDGQEFGQKNVEDLLRHSGKDPAQFIDQLFQQITTSVQQDDLTVVLTQFD
jgi:sigma-B regulation protein RsbU (phosphoserine phosphatase)